MKSSNLKVSFPGEIWTLIIAHIPCGPELWDLMGVNSTFFDLIMAARYKNVEIGDITDEMLKKLERLRDPKVGQRVRRLHWKPRYSTSQTSPTEMVQILNPVLKSMTNVTELILLWDRSRYAVSLERCLPGVWRSLGRTLRSLNIGGEYPAVEIVIQSFPSDQGARCLTALEELHLRIVRDPYYERRNGDTGVVAGTIASFINQLALQLRRFFIQANTLDLSPIFANISIPFPLLNNFAMKVGLPFHGSSDRDLSGLTRFLRDHSGTIRHAEILIHSKTTSGDMSWTQWLCDIARDPTILITLEELHFDPNDDPAGCEALVPIIRRSADTLMTLWVPNYCLTHEEAVAIVSVFSRRSRLARLWLEVSKLDADLIDLFATHLPSLQQLHLKSGEIDEEILAPADVSKRCYPEWKLQDLVILHNGRKLGVDNIMRQMATCAPSINGFVR